MNRFRIIPKEVHDAMVALRIEYSIFSNPYEMIKVLSTSDLALIQLAYDNVTSNFFPVVQVGSLEDSPITMLKKEINDDSDHVLYDVYRELTGLVDGLRFKQDNNSVDVYTLYPVNGDFWVVLQQRLHNVEGDLDKRKLKENEQFFDELISIALRTQSFEEVFKSSLFTSYLKAI